MASFAEAIPATLTAFPCKTRAAIWVASCLMVGKEKTRSCVTPNVAFCAFASDEERSAPMIRFRRNVALRLKAEISVKVEDSEARYRTCRNPARKGQPQHLPSSPNVYPPYATPTSFPDHPRSSS